MNLIAFLFAILALVTAENSKIFNNPNAEKEKDHDYWVQLGKADLKKAMEREILNHRAKNIIIFIGDGMGITVTTAGRIYKGQREDGNSGEEGHLVWEKFPNSALIKTYAADKQVADSSSTATAIYGGIKINFHAMGVDKNVQLEDCATSLNKSYNVDSVLKWAQDAGKETGFVTTTRVTHATPGALYAHSASRYWECDTDFDRSSTNTTGCRDIAVQLVEDSPGKDIKVILAGGRSSLGATLMEEGDVSCNRTDGRNLVKEWEADKKERGETYEYVTNTKELKEVDLENTDYIMGLFANSHLPFEYDRRTKNLTDVPSLAAMTETAIKRLSRSDDGFFLMVEGGKIDKGLHYTQPLLALEEVVGLNKAVQVAVDSIDLSETLVIVTADHSHGITISGYPDRGNDILGKTLNEAAVDGKPYTTLLFTTGEGSNYTDFYYDESQGKVVRPDLTDVDTTVEGFIFPSYVKTEPHSEFHGGEDVSLFAIGPMSHLFHSLHEQTYIAHVMSYSACIGPFKDECAPKKEDADDN